MNTLKIGDRAIIPGWVDGYGKDHRSTITDIKTCLGESLITVKYDEPDEENRCGTVVKINHIRIEKEY